MKRKVPLTKPYPPILLHDPLSANVGQFHILVLWHKVAVAGHVPMGKLRILVSRRLIVYRNTCSVVCINYYVNVSKRTKVIRCCMKLQMCSC